MSKDYTEQSSILLDSVNQAKPQEIYLTFSVHKINSIFPLSLHFKSRWPFAAEDGLFTDSHPIKEVFSRLS